MDTVGWGSVPSRIRTQERCLGFLVSAWPCLQWQDWGHLGGLVASTVLGGGFMNGTFPGNAFFEATKKQLELLGKPKHESGIQRVLLCSICYRDSRMLK